MSTDESFLVERSLATADEVELIKAMRTQLKAELATLATEGHDFPHTTGDIFFLRVLRGNLGDVHQAVQWYRKCLQARKDYGMDLIFKEIRDLPFDLTRLPGHNCVCKHMKMIGDEASLCTPRGDIIQCDFVGGISWNRFMDEVGIDKYLSWQIYLQESKLAVVDRLSRERGHLVKYVALVDFRDFRFPPRDFMKMETKIKTEICEITGIEVVHRVMFLSVPRLFYRIWEMAKPLLPERTRQNCKILDHNFMKNPEAVAEVGALLLAKIAAARCTESAHLQEEDALQGNQRVILAGSTFEKGLAVAAGQCVKWRFRVGGPEDLAAAGRKARGNIGGLMDYVKDATDLFFSVAALWDPGEESTDTDTVTQGQFESLFENVTEERRVLASDGEVCGSAVAERAGVLVLRWSNSHGWVRAKVLASFSISIDACGDPTTGGETKLDAEAADGEQRKGETVVGAAPNGKV